MKQYLFRKASVVYAIKCNNLLEIEFAILSSNTLKILLNKIKDAVGDDSLQTINEEINIWAGQSPIAEESEINKLIRKN